MTKEEINRGERGIVALILRDSVEEIEQMNVNTFATWIKS